MYTKITKKLAFCFLIYDGINHEDLWYLFFKHVNPALYTIYIHYKQDRPLTYFNHCKLKTCVPTQYAHVSLVEAQNLLLQAALQDADNQHMIFLSNSCIPLKSFQHVYAKLNPEVSYFSLSPSAQCFPRCQALLTYIPDRANIQKASQWCILNRAHSTLLSTSIQLDWYQTIYAPDEHAYITTLYCHGLQHELKLTEQTTFTNWQSHKRGLKNYSAISAAELTTLLQSKSLFGRKFTKACDLQKYVRRVPPPNPSTRPRRMPPRRMLPRRMPPRRHRRVMRMKKPPPPPPHFKPRNKEIK